MGVPATKSIYERTSLSVNERTVPPPKQVAQVRALKILLCPAGTSSTQVPGTSCQSLDGQGHIDFCASLR